MLPDFITHIQYKDSQSKVDRAYFLYSGKFYEFDTALPDQWIRDFRKFSEWSYDQITSSFIWLYMTDYHGPAPLTLEAAKMLEQFMQDK